MMTGQLGVLAFVMPQRVSSADREDLAKFLTSVREIERQTGLDLLHELPEDIENKIEEATANRLW